MADYDISEAFQAVEEEMIDSMIRNLKHHRTLENAEGLNYTQWQAEQLAALQEYRQRNAKQFGNYFSTINAEIETALKNCYKDGNMQQEIKILEALKKGYIAPKAGIIGKTSGEFFKTNDRKLQALIDATVNDMQKAEYACLRMANDEYRKTIFNAGVYLDTGAGTLEKAVDMATKDFLIRGINCVQYANGARVAIDAYASMALRTQATRAYLQGESAKRDEWGINTVIVNKRGVACPMCLQWVGRVYYDDVWGNMPVTDDKYPRLSTAIQGGLYHSNCRDTHTTYFEGINTPPTPMTAAQKQEANRVYNLEQQQRYNERNIRKYKRLEAGQLDAEDKAKYTAKREYWEQRNADFVKANGDVLKRRLENEKTRGITSFTPPPVVVEPQTVEPTVAKVAEPSIKQKDAVEYYVSGDGMYINHYLRDGETAINKLGAMRKEDEELIANLEAATDRAHDNKTLYRSVDASAVFGDMSQTEYDDLYNSIKYGANDEATKQAKAKFLDNIAGKEITEKGFMSTTKDAEIATDFGDFTGSTKPMVIEFTNADKVKGFDVGEYMPELEKQMQQSEVLLHNNQNYVIKSVSAKDGNIIVKAEFKADSAADVIAKPTPKPELVKPETVAKVNEPSFVPAKTIEEAEAYADKFVSTYKSKYSGNVSFKGMDLESANKINKVLTETYEKYGADKLGNLTVMNFRETKWKKAVDDGVAAAYQWGGNGGTMFINQKLFASSKTVESFKKKADNLLQTVLVGVDKLLAREGIKPMQAAYLKALKKTGVQCVAQSVDDFAEATFVHEIGHSLDDKLFRKLFKETGFDLAASMGEYAGNISGYAVSSQQEYVAESFTSFWYGKTNTLDPKLVEIFKGAMR